MVGLDPFYSEPNNDSPLNAQAAELWKSQEGVEQLTITDFYIFLFIFHFFRKLSF